MPARSSTALIAVCIALPGHAAQSKPEDPQQLAAEYRKMDYGDFCLRIGRTLRNGPDKTGAIRYDTMLKVAAEQPFNLTKTNHTDIKRRQIAIGMSWCGVFAALGAPDRNNRTVTPAGERYQYVYENPRRYVYIQNYRVIGWQD